MIKAAELRIGNLVRLFLGIGDNGPEYRYLPIVGIMHDNRYLIGNTWVELSNNIEGVPLSEGILLKAGFEKCLNGFWSETEIFNVKIIDNEILVYLAGSDTNLAHNNLKNLHQLQNLIHALTGEELTINL